ncbi:MAG: OpgC domain-containing protein [Deltaproteobacteria bacterium]|nr:OpgC domain-containing protein [Deltaproteobacteria bacterium]
MSARSLPQPSYGTHDPGPEGRDVRLDFFRALALLLIFVAHMPGNSLAQYRPGCFGFSDSADIFVFVSGCAAAIAYSKIFRRAGFVAGTARVLKRCSELYACHLGLFFAVAMLLVAGNKWLDTDVDYIALLNLGYFFEHTREALLGLFTLTYVPNYFDILPMYMVAMAMLPLVMLIAQLHVALAGALCVALYVAVPLFGWELPAEIAFDRPWFFNPFSWQLLFYTGFFLGTGWVKTPRSRVWLTACCASYVTLSIPLSYYPAYSGVGWLNAVQKALGPLINKTDLGILRLLHFWCLAYLAVGLLRGREHVLRGRVVAPIVKTGQQALPVFLTGMALSHLGGMTLDVWGRSIGTTVVMNVAGFVFLTLTAYVVAWFKSQPWRSAKTT